MSSSDYKIANILKLELDSKIGKDRHFVAAEKKQRNITVLGLVSVIGSAIIASNALSEILSLTNWISLKPAITAVIALIVSISTATLGFLKLDKQVAKHREVGNKYIEISRESLILLHKMYDDINYKDYETEYVMLFNKYIEANKEGENAPTTKSDSTRSMELNEKQKRRVKSILKGIDQRLFPEPQMPSQITLAKLISISAKIKIAKLFSAIGVIGKSQYYTYMNRALRNLNRNNLQS